MSQPVAYSYLRFSTPEQSRGDSYRRQASMAKDYAARHNLALDERLTFHDLGISAFRGRNADEGNLGAFLEAVRSGTIAQGSYLLVESLDRLSRQTARRALRTLEDIVDQGVVLVTLSDSRAYTKEALDSDPTSLLIAIITFMRANEESEMKSRRLSASWENKRQNARNEVLTARCPAWLQVQQDRRGFELIPNRAAIVRRIFAMALDGVGQHRIAETLNREGVTTWGSGTRTPATHWHRSYIVKILSNPATYGMFTPRVMHHEDGRKVFRDTETLPGYYPGAIDEETFRRAQALRNGPIAPRRGRHAATPVQHLLAGLAQCPLCGGRMTRVSKGSRARSGRPYLVCTSAKSGAGCTYKAVQCEIVERGVARLGEGIVSRASAAEGSGELDATYNATIARIVEINEQLFRLTEAVATGASRTIDRRIVELEEELLRLELRQVETRDRIDVSHHAFVQRRLANLGEALRDFSGGGAGEPEGEGMSGNARSIQLQRANALLRTAVDGVTVDYRRKMLVFRWKHGKPTEEPYAGL
jgi:DNA invertase Pin-like site-specific DNA recombinase